MAETAKLKLPKISGNMTADVPRDMNALADAIDAKAGVAGGLATIDANGKVVNADGSIAGGANPNYLSNTGYATATGTANAYIATLTPALTAYAESVSLRLKINVGNTGTATVNVNGLGAKTIKKANGEDVKSGDLKAGSIYTLVYNGVNFQLQGEGGDLTAQQRADFVSKVNQILLM